MKLALVTVNLIIVYFSYGKATFSNNYNVNCQAVVLYHH